MARDTDMGGPGGGRFPATRHSAVLAAQSADLIERERGLAILLETYWRPAYKYVLIRFGESNEDAKDLTQAFFTRALEKDFFAGYDAEKGTFRTYLRTCLDRFVANERKAAFRAKRSPGAPLLPLDFDGAEGELAMQEPPDPASMEHYFHAEWVRSLFALSVERLREECERRGKDLPYRLFERYELDRDPDERLTYDRLAEEFQIPATQVTNFLALARREFRRIVLERLREITATDREFREEARSLLGVSE
jgi:DNA-directed RNA polymerase specialized sigma24 family protein